VHGRRLEQGERAGDVDVDEALRRHPRDIRLVQCAGMDDRLDAVLREDAREPDEPVRRTRMIDPGIYVRLAGRDRR
jgi:hypothetical protein